MSTIQGSAYVIQDGLVFYMDAANPKCFDPAGSNWIDLTGNQNDGSLYNGAFFDSAVNGSLDFDGSNDYCSTNFTPYYDISLDFSWDVWCYPRSNSYEPMVGNRDNYANPNCFAKLTGSAFEWFTLAGQSNIFYSPTTYQWGHICITKSSSLLSYYYNTELVGTASSPNSSITAKPFWIGGDPDAGEYANCKVACVKVYNKALTIDEIGINFQALKIRFGI